MTQKPLDPCGGDSPSIGVRLTRDVRERVFELARSSGETPSALVRRAIERELALAGPAPPDDG